MTEMNKCIQKIKMHFLFRLIAYFAVVLISWFVVYFYFSSLHLVLLVFLLFMVFIFLMIGVRGTFTVTEKIREVCFGEHIVYNKEQRFSWEKKVFRNQYYFRVVVAVVAVIGYFFIVRKVAAADSSLLLSALLVIFSLEQIMSAKRFSNHCIKVNHLMTEDCTEEELDRCINEIGFRNIIVKES